MVDPHTDVAGLKVNTLTKQELLIELEKRIGNKQKTFLTTLYSEFLFHSLRDRKLMSLLNSADFAVPDGVGLLWADLFLSKPFHTKRFLFKIFEAWFQVVYTGASILFNPGLLYKTFPEKIVGADLAWDLAGLASKNGFSIFLLGGRGATAQQTASKFLEKFPELKIVGTSNKFWQDETILNDVRTVSPDILLVAFDPRNQEKWISQNLANLPVSFAVGLGGTFDYISGEKQAPPKFVRKVGLEWLFRLVSQPSRIGRIYDAVWGLTLSLVRLKVFNSLPFRENVSIVVVNKKNEVFVSRSMGTKVFANLNHKGTWQFPQGGIDKNESVSQAATRELQEEANITSIELIAVGEKENEYFWPNATKKLLFSKYLNCGARQKTAYFKFLGNDKEIKVDHREFSEFQWVKVDDLDTFVAEERILHTKLVQAELSKLLSLEKPLN